MKPYVLPVKFIIMMPHIQCSYGGNQGGGRTVTLADEDQRDSECATQE